MSNEITRLYHYEDEAMIVKAQVMHNNLVADMSIFAARFPWITAATVTAMQTSIDLAEALPLDSQILADLKVLTSDANAQVILGAEALAVLGQYAKLTYPKNDARQRVFGQDLWAAAKSDQEKMMNALEHAHMECVKPTYNTDLIAKGYTATEIANLLTIADSIKANNNLQEDAKSERPVTTQERINAYNNVWQQMQTINVCSKVCFANDPAKLEQYMLYPNSTENTKVKITCLKAGTTDVLPDAMVTLTNTSLAPAETNASGNVEFNSVNMPDLLDVKIIHPMAGNADYTNLTVVLGTTNDFTFEVPSP